MPVPYSRSYRILFWLALIGSYVLAVIPQEIAPEIGELSDKTLHFIAFAVLTILIHLAYALPIWKSVMMLIAYAFFIEFSQYFTPNRCAEWLDIVADTIGIAIGLIIYMLYCRAKRYRENR